MQRRDLNAKPHVLQHREVRDMRRSTGRRVRRHGHEVGGKLEECGVLKIKWAKCFEVEEGSIHVQ